MPTYLPSREADLRLWVENFKTKTTAAPATYGIVAGNATDIANAITPFGTAYDALVTARASNTDTPAMVLAKDVAKASMLVVVRNWAQVIRNNPGVTDANKAALGLTLVNFPPTPIPPPSTYPILNVTAPGPLQQTISYADSATPTARRRPFGAIGQQMYRFTGTVAGTDPEDAQFRGFVTRQPFTFNFDSGDRGKLATYWSRWQNAKGEVGPWSAPVTLAVP